MSDTFLVKWEVNFTRMPNWLLTFKDKDGKSLSDKAIRTYFALASFADNNTMEAFPSQALLAERADMSTRSVQRYLKELTDFEIIKVFKKSNGKDKWVSNIYQLSVNAPKSMVVKEKVTNTAEPVIVTGDIYADVDLGMTANNKRKRTLNDEVFDGFSEFIGSKPVDDKVIGDWISNIPRLIEIFKSENVDPTQFKLVTQTACALYVNKYGDSIALNPRTLADNWLNVKPKKYTKAVLQQLESQGKYSESLPTGVTETDGRIVLDG